MFFVIVSLKQHSAEQYETKSKAIQNNKSDCFTTLYSICNDGYISRERNTGYYNGKVTEDSLHSNDTESAANEESIVKAI